MSAPLCSSCNNAPCRFGSRCHYGPNCYNCHCASLQTMPQRPGPHAFPVNAGPDAQGNFRKFEDDRVTRARQQESRERSAPRERQAPRESYVPREHQAPRESYVPREHHERRVYPNGYKGKHYDPNFAQKKAERFLRGMEAPKTSSAVAIPLNCVIPSNSRGEVNVSVGTFLRELYGKEPKIDDIESFINSRIIDLLVAIKEVNPKFPAIQASAVNALKHLKYLKDGFDTNFKAFEVLRSPTYTQRCAAIFSNQFVSQVDFFTRSGMEKTDGEGRPTSTIQEFVAQMQVTANGESLGEISLAEQRMGARFRSVEFEGYLKITLDDDEGKQYTARLDVSNLTYLVESCRIFLKIGEKDSDTNREVKKDLKRVLKREGNELCSQRSVACGFERFMKKQTMRFEGFIEQAMRTVLIGMILYFPELFRTGLADNVWLALPVPLKAMFSAFGQSFDEFAVQMFPKLQESIDNRPRTIQQVFRPSYSNLLGYIDAEAERLQINLDFTKTIRN